MARVVKNSASTKATRATRAAPTSVTAAALRLSEAEAKEAVLGFPPATQTHSEELTGTSALAPVIQLSDEQLAIAQAIQTGKGNLVVRARAGTGKTYLIRRCVPLMLGEIAICAYNKKIAREIRDKLVQDGHALRSFTDRQARLNVGTFHSFGWRVLTRHLKGVRLDDLSKNGFRKFDLIAERLSISKPLQGLVRKAMERAQERLFGVTIPFNDREAWLDLARHYALELDLPPDDSIEMQLLHATPECREMEIEELRGAMLRKCLSLAARAIQLGARMASEEFTVKRTIGRGDNRRVVDGEQFTGLVTFGEMLYLPLYFNMPIPSYDWVCVDEAQDSNPARREFAKRMCRAGTRMMWVGDDRQAIYGWAGADNDAMDQIINQFRCHVHPMTVTFRCGRAIVALAQTIVPDYKAAATNSAGSVPPPINEEEFQKTELLPTDAIICRNTAPLVKHAYKLIGRGVACHVEGKDIGRALLPLLYRWKVKNIAPFVTKLTEYRDTETAKFEAAKNEAAADQLNDRVETILAIIEYLPKGSMVSDIQAHVERLFADTPEGKSPDNVTLMTIHRSKGLEYPRVFGLGNNKYLPSPYAKQDWQRVQEDNLRYVLYTRAINEYTDVTVV